MSFHYNYKSILFYVILGHDGKPGMQGIQGVRGPVGERYYFGVDKKVLFLKKISIQNLIFLSLQEVYFLQR